VESARSPQYVRRLFRTRGKTLVRQAKVFGGRKVAAQWIMRASRGFWPEAEDLYLGRLSFQGVRSPVDESGRP
jgi:hypothetical protein